VKLQFTVTGEPSELVVSVQRTVLTPTGKKPGGGSHVTTPQFEGTSGTS
jgi:hypothetical protein